MIDASVIAKAKEDKLVQPELFAKFRCARCGNFDNGTGTCGKTGATPEEDGMITCYMSDWWDRLG